MLKVLGFEEYIITFVIYLIFKFEELKELTFEVQIN